LRHYGYLTVKTRLNSFLRDFNHFLISWLNAFQIAFFLGSELEKVLNYWVKSTLAEESSDIKEREGKIEEN
jgi:hypothetical protein